jgi:hypothetical protein
LLILVCAILNGALREGVLIPWMGAQAGLIASGVILCSVILAVAFFLLPRSSAAQALGIGALWLALTLAFEFGFGMIQGKSWSEILAAYTFRDGNLWPLVLLVTLLAPLLASRRA